MFRTKFVLVLAVMLSIITPKSLLAAPGDVRNALEGKGIKRIAVIPPAELKCNLFDYLKKEGLDKSVTVLNTRDYVNPDIFNPKNFPIAIYAGYEKYTKNVKEPNDGDRAILNYIAKGGTLIVFANGPAPFFYNEKNGMVDASSLFGINIAKGANEKFKTAFAFEKPEGLGRLSFVTQKDLKGVEGSLDRFLFPSKEDLRWRPMVNKTDSKAYIPLISLMDDKGNWLGDAAAYNSGVIYVWFRLTQADEPNSEKIIGGILKFAAKGSSLPRESSNALNELEKTSSLAKRFKDKAIALVPGNIQAPIEPWLGQSNLMADKLTWEDVINPAKFNAKNYPIMIYVGGEKYTQTVKSMGDVDAALIKYENDGGMIILLSQEPWPMYMNNENAPTMIVGKLGFPICGMDDTGNMAPDARYAGFEKPKDGEKMAYYVNTGKLPNLPAKVDYANDDGDKRWRPINGSALSSKDIYIPLVTLKDAAGNEYGQGIAYIEHKETNPVGGKGIYVWVRGQDLLGMEKMYNDLFSFIATVLK